MKKVDRKQYAEGSKQNAVAFWNAGIPARMSAKREAHLARCARFADKDVRAPNESARCFLPTPYYFLRSGVSDM